MLLQYLIASAEVQVIISLPLEESVYFPFIIDLQMIQSEACAFCSSLDEV